MAPAKQWAHCPSTPVNLLSRTSGPVSCRGSPRSPRSFYRIRHRSLIAAARAHGLKSLPHPIDIEVASSPHGFIRICQWSGSDGLRREIGCNDRWLLFSKEPRQYRRVYFAAMARNHRNVQTTGFLREGLGSESSRTLHKG